VRSPAVDGIGVHDVEVGAFGLFAADGFQRAPDATAVDAYGAVADIAPPSFFDRPDETVAAPWISHLYL
jgi:hypothetical protein